MTSRTQLSEFTTADTIRRQIVKTGTEALDDLLGGGLEVGLTYLFYGDSQLHDDLLRIAVSVQRPQQEGGLQSPTVVIDSVNILRSCRLAEYAIELGLEPEEVIRRIYVSRAFNSSQVFVLIMDELEEFFSRIRARLLIVSGFPDLFISEGVNVRHAQQMTQMARKISTFTMRHGIVTLVSAPSSRGDIFTPAGGRALASSAQVHICVESLKSYIRYTLTKHPQYPVKRSSRPRESYLDLTPPLSDFLDI
ncbi:MAG: hypothetical protein QXS20_02595 [Candidatus Thorarchaeota archaeon]